AVSPTTISSQRRRSSSESSGNSLALAGPTRPAAPASMQKRTSLRRLPSSSSLLTVNGVTTMAKIPFQGSDIVTSGRRMAIENDADHARLEQWYRQAFALMALAPHGVKQAELVAFIAAPVGPPDGMGQVGVVALKADREADADKQEFGRAQL